MEFARQAITHKNVGILVGVRTSTRGWINKLALSAAFGATLSVVAVADWPWPLAFGAGAILFLVARTLWRRKTEGAGSSCPQHPVWVSWV